MRLSFHLFPFKGHTILTFEEEGRFEFLARIPLGQNALHELSFTIAYDLFLLVFVSTSMIFFFWLVEALHE